MPDDGGVRIAFCATENVSVRFTQSLADLARHDGKGPDHIDYIQSIVTSPRIAAARNELVSRFLDSESEWLWMVDTDMIFEKDTLDRLLEVADATSRPVVGGLAFIGGNPDGAGGITAIRSNAFIMENRKDSETGKDYIGMDPVEGIGGQVGNWGSVIRVHSTGAACLLVHRWVYEKVKEENFNSAYHWFMESERYGKGFGEDVTFCARLLQLDIPVHVHTGVQLGHHKTVIVDADAHASYLRSTEPQGENGQKAARHEIEKARRKKGKTPPRVVRL